MAANLPPLFNALTPQEIDEIFTKVVLRHKKRTPYILIMTEIIRIVEAKIRLQIIANARKAHDEERIKLLASGSRSGQPDGEGRGVHRPRRSTRKKSVDHA